MTDRRCAGCDLDLDPNGEIHTLSPAQAEALDDPALDGLEYHEECCPFCQLPTPLQEATLLLEGKLGPVE